MLLTAAVEAMTKKTSDVKQAWVTGALVLVTSLFFGLVILPKIGNNSALVGSPAPDFTLPVIHQGEAGSRLHLADLRGKTVVLDFWASWCPPCREQAPILDAFAQRAGGEVKVIGVNTSDAPEQAQAFLQSSGLRYPSVVDHTGAVGQAYGATALPTLVVIAPSGKVAAVRQRVVRARELGEIVADARAE